MNFGDILTSTLKNADEVLSIPEKDALSHEQAGLLGATLEAGLEMYKGLQNTYLGGKKDASLSTRQKRYKTMEHPTPPPRVASKAAEDLRKEGATLRKEELMQAQYEVEEEENNGYSVLNGCD